MKRLSLALLLVAILVQTVVVQSARRSSSRSSSYRSSSSSGGGGSCTGSCGVIVGAVLGSIFGLLGLVIAFIVIRARIRRAAINFGVHHVASFHKKDTTAKKKGNKASRLLTIEKVAGDHPRPPHTFELASSMNWQLISLPMQMPVQLHFEATAASVNMPSTIQANAPLSPKFPCYGFGYYEVKVEYLSSYADLCIGIAEKDYPSNVCVGQATFPTRSVGWHSSAGKVYDGGPDSRLTLPVTFKTGNTVGIGLDFTRGRVYFVLNGTVWKEYKGFNGEYYPTITATGGCRLTVNFGSEPFMYADAVSGGKRKDNVMFPATPGRYLSSSDLEMMMLEQSSPADVPSYVSVSMDTMPLAGSPPSFDSVVSSSPVYEEHSSGLVSSSIAIEVEDNEDSAEFSMPFSGAEEPVVYASSIAAEPVPEDSAPPPDFSSSSASESNDNSPYGY